MFKSNYCSPELIELRVALESGFAVSENGAGEYIPEPWDELIMP